MSCFSACNCCLLAFSELCGQSPPIDFASSRGWSSACWHMPHHASCLTSSLNTSVHATPGALTLLALLSHIHDPSHLQLHPMQYWGWESVLHLSQPPVASGRHCQRNCSQQQIGRSSCPHPLNRGYTLLSIRLLLVPRASHLAPFPSEGAARAQKSPLPHSRSPRLSIP